MVVETDIHGDPHYKRAFNPQACKQLNAWLGGLEKIANQMSAANFDWFLHVMLFVHSSRVMQKIEEKIEVTAEDPKEEGSDLGDDDE